MRRSSFRSLAARLIAALLMVAALEAQSAPRVRLGTIVPQGSSYYNHLRHMGQAWQAAPNGGVNLVIYPDGRMGGEAEMVRRMRNGQLQAGLLTAVGLGEIEPDVAGLQSIPMMFETAEEIDYVGMKLQPQLEERLAAKGFVVLFWADAGWVQFFSSEPVIYPADLKRLKVWTWAGNPAQVDIYKKAGFTPVPLETKDLILSLQTKAVTAVPIPPTVAMVSQVDKLAPHMLEINWAPLVGACIILKSTWDQLPPATQLALRESARLTGEQIQADGRKEAQESIAAMVGRGLTVHKVTPQIRSQWKETSQDAYQEIRGRIVPEAIFDDVKRLLEEFRSRNRNSP